jgi:competence transcription factor ComK
MGSAALLDASAEPPILIARQNGELFFPNDAASSNNSIVK